MYSLDPAGHTVPPTLSMDAGFDAATAAAGLVKPKGEAGSLERPAATGGMMTGGPGEEAPPMDSVGAKEPAVSDPVGADGALAGASTGIEAASAVDAEQQPSQPEPEGPGVMTPAAAVPEAEQQQQEQEQRQQLLPPPAPQEEPEAAQPPVPEPQQPEQQAYAPTPAMEPAVGVDPSLMAPALHPDGLVAPAVAADAGAGVMDRQQPPPPPPLEQQAGIPVEVPSVADGQDEDPEQAVMKVVELKMLLENAKTTIKELNAMLVRYEEENARLRQYMEELTRPNQAAGQQGQGKQEQGPGVPPDMKPSIPAPGPNDIVLAPPLPATGPGGAANPQTNHFRALSGDSQFSLGSTVSTASTAVSSLATGGDALGASSGGVKRPRPDGLPNGPAPPQQQQQQQQQTPQELPGAGSGLLASASSTGSTAALGTALGNTLVLGAEQGQQQQQQQQEAAASGTDGQGAAADAAGSTNGQAGAVASSGPPQPVKNYRKSCDFCTSTKIRCDGAKPTCENCAKRSILCHYSERKRPGPKINSSFNRHGSMHHWHPSYGRHAGPYGPPPPTHHPHHAAFAPGMPGLPPMAPSYAHAPALHHHQHQMPAPPGSYAPMPAPQHYMGGPMHGAAGGGGMEPHMASAQQMQQPLMGQQQMGMQQQMQPQMQPQMQMGQQMQPQMQHSPMLPQQHQQQPGQQYGHDHHAEAAAALMNMPLRMGGPGQPGGPAPAPGQGQMPGAPMGMAPQPGQHNKLLFSDMSQDRRMG